MLDSCAANENKLLAAAVISRHLPVRLGQQTIKQSEDLPRLALETKSEPRECLHSMLNDFRGEEMRWDKNIRAALKRARYAEQRVVFYQRWYYNPLAEAIEHIGQPYLLVSESRKAFCWASSSLHVLRADCGLAEEEQSGMFVSTIKVWTILSWPDSNMGKKKKKNKKKTGLGIKSN